jgi:hypothetical protein
LLALPPTENNRAQIAVSSWRRDRWGKHARAKASRRIGSCFAGTIHDFLAKRVA